MNQDEILPEDFISRMYHEISKPLFKSRKAVCFFFDFRGLKKLTREQLEAFFTAKSELIERGFVKRAVYIMNSPVSMMQMKRLSRDVGFLKKTRFIDSRITENWEEVGLGWLINSEDPEPKKRR